METGLWCFSGQLFWKHPIWSSDPNGNIYWATIKPVRHKPLSNAGLIFPTALAGVTTLGFFLSFYCICTTWRCRWSKGKLSLGEADTNRILKWVVQTYHPGQCVGHDALLLKTQLWTEERATQPVCPRWANISGWKSFEDHNTHMTRSELSLRPWSHPMS